MFSPFPADQGLRTALSLRVSDFGGSEKASLWPTFHCSRNWKTIFR
jgi:hypothetical protein